MKQFQAQTAPVPRIEFAIAGQVFEATGEPPADALLITAQMALGDDSVARIGSMAGFLDLVLLPESRDRFVAGMRDIEHPITAATVGEVVAWLLEQYLGTPTDAPSQSSAASSSGDGAPSMATVPALA